MRSLGDGARRPRADSPTPTPRLVLVCPPDPVCTCARPGTRPAACHPPDALPHAAHSRRPIDHSTACTLAYRLYHHRKKSKEDKTSKNMLMVTLCVCVCLDVCSHFYCSVHTCHPACCRHPACPVCQLACLRALPTVAPSKDMGIQPNPPPTKGTLNLPYRT